LKSRSFSDPAFPRKSNGQQRRNAITTRVRAGGSVAKHHGRIVLMKILGLLFAILFMGWFGIGLMYQSTVYSWAQLASFPGIKQSIVLIAIWIIFFGAGAFIIFASFIDDDNLIAQLRASF
jgi:hypothetical protein